MLRRPRCALYEQDHQKSPPVCISGRRPMLLAVATARWPRHNQRHLPLFWPRPFMRSIRVFHSQPLQLGQRVALDEQASAHLLRVLRLADGDPVQLFDGRGQQFAARLEGCERKQAWARIDAVEDYSCESPLALHLAQGVARGDKMDLTIMKSVELGVARITPLLTERCGVRLSDERWDKKLQHWQRVAISACEQCGRNQVPEVAEPLTLTQLLAAHQGVGLLLDPYAAAGLAALPQFRAATLLVGPEGGLSTAEVSAARAAGFTPIRFGPRILRTETAAWACMAALQARFGDLG